MPEVMSQPDVRCSRPFASNQHSISRRARRLLGLLCACAMVWLGCSPKLYIKQSFRQSVELPLSEGTVALNRGETIELTEILKKEKTKPTKVILTRLFGGYLLTAEGFVHIWLIQPSGRESATFKGLTSPTQKPLKEPKFEHSESHNCVILTLAGSDRWHIHASGHIARSCSDVSK